MPFFLVGESAALGAALVWSGSMIGFRLFGVGFPAREINFFKNGVAVACLVGLLLVLGSAWPARAETWGLLVLSGLVGIALGDTAFFAALSRLNTQVTAVIQCLSPVTAAVLAWVWLGETLRWNEIFGMALTLGAVAGAILLGGHSRTIHRHNWRAGLAFAVLSAVSNGTGIVIARSAFQEVDATVGTFIRVAAAFLVLMPMVLAQRPSGFRFRQALRPMGRAVGLTVSAFAGSFLGLLLMSVGIKYAKAGVAAALSITYPLWILPLSRLILDERSTVAGMVCILLAVFGVALMFYR